MEDAVCRYLWNAALCESLYPSFQVLEVGFRNALHCEIADMTFNRQWISDAPSFLYSDELVAIKAAKDAARQRRRPVSEDVLIAELRFGFWTSLLDSRYETMWHRIIADVFPHMPRTIRTRREVSKLMNTVRRLRNAALHHHSIWHWRDLEAQHSQMRLLTTYICESLGMIAKQIDRFPSIYAAGPDQFKPLTTSILSSH
jgi:hypothetical protein